MPPRVFARSRTMRAVSGIPIPCAETVGCRINVFSSSTYSRSRARTYASNSAKPVTPRRLASGGQRRRSGLAPAELAPRRERRHLDPSLLAEVLNDAVDVLDRLALVNLRARNHEDTVAAVRRKRRSRAIRRARRGESESEPGEGEHDQKEDDEEDRKIAHIRRRLPRVSTLAGRCCA